MIESALFFEVRFSRLIVIQVGHPIEFINEDEKSHYLESVNLQGKRDRFFTTDEIKTGESVTIKSKNFNRYNALIFLRKI